MRQLSLSHDKSRAHIFDEQQAAPHSGGGMKVKVRDRVRNKTRSGPQNKRSMRVTENHHWFNTGLRPLHGCSQSCVTGSMRQYAHGFLQDHSCLKIQFDVQSTELGKLPEAATNAGCPTTDGRAFRTRIHSQHIHIHIFLACAGMTNNRALGEVEVLGIGVPFARASRWAQRLPD